MAVSRMCNENMQYNRY